MSILVCYYGGGKSTRERIDEDFSDEELWLTMVHRRARFCEVINEVGEA